MTAAISFFAEVMTICEGVLKLWDFWGQKEPKENSKKFPVATPPILWYKCIKIINTVIITSHAERRIWMILLDYKDSRPIYEQVEDRLKELMILGVLEEDGQMPSVRSLAMELSINPNTIQRAYAELERNGFIYSVKGRGSFVGSINRLREAKRQDLMGDMKDLAKEAKNLGMSRDEFAQAAVQGYDEGGETV